jgi:ketosteroid isomerase-like protein
MRTGIAAIAGALLAALLSPAEALGRTPSGKCAGAEHRQFDFWAGNWDAYGLDEGGKLVARARVEIILDGCALLEIYDQLDGLKGQSFSIYDSSRQTWHQSWVTNRGKLLTLEGRFQDGRMTLTGSDRDANGRAILIRGVWKRAEGGVRETADTSEDDGKTWKLAFDILFKPRESPAAAASEDEKIVAALDTQYQAAVAKNDAAVMDRILANDFILVTGRGKVYTKADLLADARSGKTVYERQDDASQKVRVWGDTAVVTALLTAKGTREGKPFSYRLWFSDTYVRTSAGWRYVFGQASSPLPETE